MSIFNRKTVAPTPASPGQVVSGQPAQVVTTSPAPFAELALATIHDGVLITDKSGVVCFANPAAATMIDMGAPVNLLGLDYGLVLKIESKEGREISDAENPVFQAMRTGQPLEVFQACLISGASAKRIPIAISIIPAASGHRIITFRNITRELAEEGEQAEFISTASHEMRTPVASIEGYLALALNPQTATIDNRARGYLDAAHKASKHLGHLFQDLLDTTKLDDGRIRPRFAPVEMVGLVKQFSDEFIPRAHEAKLSFQFGTTSGDLAAPDRRLDQVVYGYVDLDFMREIMGNLIDNAIKYTPAGGAIYINVHGDGDRVLINVTDTGIGISSDDIGHIFQKFYRADNSDTRTIGGTGLGLYLVKQRAEAMGGRVWAESGFGEGTTFYVSLPRITGEEYEKRLIALQNANMVNNNQGGIK
ncbi:HAMP domain-containing histidine kinase [Candidatus Saccharibacteria bacterium]|nr:HAMP domain-containing histidine kinase [Candidatus Saccharibacteria bacterium]